MYWKRPVADWDAGCFAPFIPKGLDKAYLKYYVQLSDDDYQVLVDGMKQGKEVHDVDGWPTLVDPVVTTNELASQARAKRDDLLSSVEWRVTRYNTQVQLGVTPTESDIKPVLEYMQKLRDLPTTEGWPKNITWPTVV